MLLEVGTQIVVILNTGDTTEATITSLEVTRDDRWLDSGNFLDTQLVEKPKPVARVRKRPDLPPDSAIVFGHRPPRAAREIRRRIPP